jgi:hypothetical protein
MDCLADFEAENSIIKTAMFQTIFVLTLVLDFNSSNLNIVSVFDIRISSFVSLEHLDESTTMATGAR